mmetsp:Transcript_47870/g.89621  ORF Transcript_47870/g.89621 Transcript_47870/m.89621 type:complete len:83 (-) Transcript_47870:4-252(-)
MQPKAAATPKHIAQVDCQTGMNLSSACAHSDGAHAQANVGVCTMLLCLKVHVRRILQYLHPGWIAKHANQMLVGPSTYAKRL